MCWHTIVLSASSGSRWLLEKQEKDRLAKSYQEINRVILRNSKPAENNFVVAGLEEEQYTMAIVL